MRAHLSCLLKDVRLQGSEAILQATYRHNLFPATFCGRLSMVYSKQDMSPLQPDLSWTIRLVYFHQKSRFRFSLHGSSGLGLFGVRFKRQKNSEEKNI